MSKDNNKNISASIAQELAKATGEELKTIVIRMRDCDDVPKFLRKLEEAQKHTREHAIQIG